MGKIKTLHLTTTFLRSREESDFIIDYTKRMVGRGLGVDVVAPHDREKTRGFEVVGGMKIHRFQYFFPKGLQRLAYNGGVAFNLANSSFAKLQFPFFMASFFLKALRNVRGKDLIQAHWIPAGLIAVILKKLTGKPVVIFIHRMVYGNFVTKSINRFVLGNCDFVIFNSSYTMKKTRKLCKVRHSAVIPPSVDMALFKKIARPGVRKKLGLRPEQKIIFAIGRFVEKKGLPYLIEAMARLKTKNAVCVIAGFGPLEKDLKKLVEKKGLQKKVLFAGTVPNREVPLWMNEAAVVVVPSIFDSEGETETLGIVAIEALACGKPVIASKVGGLVDVVKDGVSGFLVKEKDSAELAKKIGLVLGNSSSASSIGKKARSFVEKNFALPVTVDRTIEVYRSLVKRG